MFLCRIVRWEFEFTDIVVLIESCDDTSHEELYIYWPPTKLREGNVVYTNVCLSTGG